MRNTAAITEKIYTVNALLPVVAKWRADGNTISFTNGVFDILHEGHIYSLSQAAAEGDKLVVAINSDLSVKRLKGPDRPVNGEKSRALLMAALMMVDAVVIFEEDTPLEVIKALLPDTLVKGGDYKPHEVAGSTEVIANGGRVVINALIEGMSTTGIIAAIQNQSAKSGV